MRRAGARPGGRRTGRGRRQGHRWSVAVRVLPVLTASVTLGPRPTGPAGRPPGKDSISARPRPDEAGSHAARSGSKHPRHGGSLERLADRRAQVASAVGDPGLRADRPADRRGRGSRPVQSARGPGDGLASTSGSADPSRPATSSAASRGKPWAPSSARCFRMSRTPGEPGPNRVSAWDGGRVSPWSKASCHRPTRSSTAWAVGGSSGTNRPAGGRSSARCRRQTGVSGRATQAGRSPASTTQATSALRPLSSRHDGRAVHRPQAPLDSDGQVAPRRCRSGAEAVAGRLLGRAVGAEHQAQAA